MQLPRSEKEAVAHFRSETKSRDFMISRRWPNGIACPQCGSRTVYVDPSRGRWECKNRHARRTFTVKTGTIFEDSPLSLGNWLITIWLVANRASIGSHELARKIGVTQKTAWLMLQRIRLALSEAPEAPGTPDK